MIAGIIDNEIHILRSWCEKATYARLLEASRNAIDRYGPSHFIIENTSTGPALFYDIQADYGGIDWANPKTDKVTHALSYSNIINAKRVFLPKKDYPWAKPFEDELFGFPGSPFDDQVDAFNLVLRAVRQGLSALKKVRYRKQPSLTAYPGPKHPIPLG